MRRFLLLGIALLLAFETQNAGATTPASGTISPSTPLLTFTGGPYTGANPSANIPEAPGPDCDLVPGTCDDYIVTIDLPPDYATNNPNHIIAVRVAWDGSNPSTDFDLFALDPVTGAQVAPSSATSANPEIISLPLVNRDVRIRVLVFSAVNVPITGTITLGPAVSTPGAGIYTTATEIWSCNQHLLGAGEVPGPPPTVFDHSNDGEPAVRFDSNGRMFMTGIAGVPAGSGLWRTQDACGQAYSFLGAPDAGIGGGDAEIEIAPEPNVLGFQNIYMSSLTLANVTMSVSVDGGQNFTVQAISTISAAVDRQWLAAHGANTVYLSYQVGATQPGNTVEIVRWDNGGLGSPGAGPFLVYSPPVDPLTPKQHGNIVVDKRPIPAGTLPLMGGPDGEGNVYMPWVEGTRVVVSTSKNFGVTWTHATVWDGGPGRDYEHKFPWAAVDAAGNIYAAFSDDSNIYYSVSTDQGATWSNAVRVNRGGPSRTSIYPQMQAGSEGQVVFTWYGHDGTGSQDPDAEWRVFFSRCDDALSAVPTFEERIISDRNFHHGAVCEDGFACACCRELTECFEIDINPVDGSSFVTYGMFADGGLWMTRQLSGPSSIVGKTVVDRSATCPSPENLCIIPLNGNPCALPGVLVVEDVDAEDLPPAPDPQLNIQSISIAEPAGHPLGDVIVFTMKVQSLNPPDLFPNGMWRVLWNSGGLLRYVTMIKCQASPTPIFQYGDCATGCTTRGAADQGEFFADGTIRITMRKSLLNITTGQLLSGVNGESNIYTGNCPGSPAAFSPVDGTNSGQYTVLGNAYCLLPTVSCPDDFMGVPTSSGQPVDYPLTFSVTNNSNIPRTFLVVLQDDNHWLVGGTTVGPLGPIAPGGSSSVNATLRMDSQCQPRINDVISWSVEAQDNSTLAASCSTVATCELPVAIHMTAALSAVASPGGGVDLRWSVDADGELNGFHVYRGRTLETAERVTVEPIGFAGNGEFRWHDAPDPVDGFLTYRLVGILRDGGQIELGSTQIALGDASLALRLLGANPVRNGGVLEYSLPAPGHVRLELFGINGARLATLVDRVDAAGIHSVNFNLRSDDGRSLGAGVYLLRLTAGQGARTMKVVAVD